MKIYKKSSLGKSGKKIIVSLFAIVMILCLSVSLAACAQDSEPTDIPGDNTDNTDNTVNSGDNTGNTNDDIGGSGNPDGDIGEPENPGEDIGEPEDPDDNIEEPENPDGNTETPGGNTEDQKNPFVIDTINELKEYKGKTFYNYLNDNYLSTVVTKLAGRGTTVENADGFEWAITGTEAETITKLQLRFIYHDEDGAYMYYVATVTPADAISIDDILNNTDLSTPVISREYFANTTESQMAERQPLAEAIVTKLGGTLADSDLLLLTMPNPTTDPEYSWARFICVKQITDTAVNEYCLVVKAESAIDEDGIKRLIENIETGKCKNGTVENNVISLAPAFDENSLDKQTPEFEPDLADNK